MNFVSYSARVAVVAFIVILADVGMIISKPQSPLRLVAANTAVATPYRTLVEDMEKRWDTATS
jgi:hypothetical protein